jgi:hypothetical protein
MSNEQLAIDRRYIILCCHTSGGHRLQSLVTIREELYIRGNQRAQWNLPMLIPEKRAS